MLEPIIKKIEKSIEYEDNLVTLDQLVKLRINLIAAVHVGYILYVFTSKSGGSSKLNQRESDWVYSYVIGEEGKNSPNKTFKDSKQYFESLIEKIPKKYRDVIKMYSEAP